MTALATPISGVSPRITLVGVLSSNGFPFPFVSGLDPSVDISESSAPPALVAPPMALLE
jgi:hypothetical protein